MENSTSSETPTTLRILDEIRNNDPLTSILTNIIITVIVVVLAIFGSVGNILTLIVIGKNKNLRSSANYFIISLCISDLISALICSPLWLYRRTWGFEVWKWGEAACHLYWIMDFTTNFATSMHILSFAAVRYMAVRKPFTVTLITKKKVLPFIVCLWISSLLLSLPLLWLMGVDDDREMNIIGKDWPSCSILVNRNETCCVKEYNTYMVVMGSTFFYIPELLVILLSVSIARALLGRRKWMQGFANMYHISDQVQRVSAHGKPGFHSNRSSIKSNQISEASFSSNDSPSVVRSSTSHDDSKAIKDLEKNSISMQDVQLSDAAINDENGNDVVIADGNLGDVETNDDNLRDVLSNNDGVTNVAFETANEGLVSQTENCSKNEAAEAIPQHLLSPAMNFDVENNRNYGKDIDIASDSSKQNNHKELHSESQNVNSIFEHDACPKESPTCITGHSITQDNCSSESRVDISKNSETIKQEFLRSDEEKKEENIAGSPERKISLEDGKSHERKVFSVNHKPSVNSTGSFLSENTEGKTCVDEDKNSADEDIRPHQKKNNSQETLLQNESGKHSNYGSVNKDSVSVVNFESEEDINQDPLSNLPEEIDNNGKLYNLGSQNFQSPRSVRAQHHKGPFQIHNSSFHNSPIPEEKESNYVKATGNLHRMILTDKMVNPIKYTRRTSVALEEKRTHSFYKNQRRATTTSERSIKSFSTQRRSSTTSLAMERQYQQERTTFTQLCFVNISFILGYIPITVYLLWTSNVNFGSRDRVIDYWFGVIAYFCLRLSECMNPVIYNLASSNIGDETRKLLREIFKQSNDT